jgi:hypothetical protein
VCGRYDWGWFLVGRVDAGLQCCERDVRMLVVPVWLVVGMTARGVVSAVVSKKWWLADVQRCINNTNMARKNAIMSVLGHVSDARRMIRGRSRQDGH